MAKHHTKRHHSKRHRSKRHRSKRHHSRRLGRAPPPISNLYGPHIRQRRLEAQSRRMPSPFRHTSASPRLRRPNMTYKMFRPGPFKNKPAPRLLSRTFSPFNDL